MRPQAFVTHITLNDDNHWIEVAGGMRIGDFESNTNTERYYLTYDVKSTKRKAMAKEVRFSDGRVWVNHNCGGYWK